MVKQYKTIYAYPPGLEIGGGKNKRGADRHYPLKGRPEGPTRRFANRRFAPPYPAKPEGV